MGTEWFVPDPSIEVRQGDVLICRDPNSGRVEEICLVVTADCDISKGKFGRQLACLRAISFNEYLRTVWAERRLKKLIKDEAEKLRGQLAKWHSLLLGFPSSLSAEAAVIWIRRDDPAKVCDDLALPEGDRKKFIAGLTAYRSSMGALDSSSHMGKLSQYVAYRAACLSRDIETCRREVLQAAQKETLPEDAFLLPSLPQLDVGGVVVMLREIVSVSYESVCYRSVDACTSDMFLRVGRLEPTFKYALSQAFGALYSRIGLPEEYERRCRKVFEDIDQITWE